MLTWDMKWLAKKIDANGRIFKKRHKRYPTIQLRVQKPDLLRAIKVLASGCTSVVVTEMLECWKVELDGVHADCWVNLITPYLKKNHVRR